MLKIWQVRRFFTKTTSAKKAAMDILDISKACPGFVNFFDRSSGYGYIAAAIKDEVKIKNIMETRLFSAIMKAPAVNSSDEMNRTPIHNIVAIKKLKTPIKIYTKAIHAFVKLGIDIDHQDTNGETALHYAVKFRNVKAVVALLALGANINKASSNLYTPFVRSLHDPNGNEKIKVPSTKLKIIRLLWEHAYKLQLANFFLTDINEKAVTIFHVFFTVDADDTEALADMIERCKIELKLFESRKIDPSSVTLYSFLSETASVTSYPHMLPRNRQAVDYLFQTRHFQLYDEFPELAGILQMQYNKALRRMNHLLKPAKSSLDVLTKFVLPDLCTYHILKFLTNDDLEKLVALEEEIMSPPQKRRKLN